ncbi:MAG: MBL fold metallo-hydrolase [Longimonas sp.]|uniref:MBL fold metallo-hydrolase n=1 Tax=Longimonas sp. TaxID=2039626 RepID=UPI00334B1ADE
MSVFCHLLGTGAAISDPHRTTTMLAFSDDAHPDQSLLVDCGGDALQRWQAVGGEIRDMAALILTHVHPDHISGLPLLMEKTWLSDREGDLPICGYQETIDQANRCMDAFASVTAGWDGMPEMVPHVVARKAGAPVWTRNPWRVTSAPVDHGPPTFGLRVEHMPSGTVMAYSCDTAPCDAVVELAHEADLLVHESNGAGPGHSSMVEAADVARAAKAKQLVLVHLPPGDKQESLAVARDTFPETTLGVEGKSYPVARS